MNSATARNMFEPLSPDEFTGSAGSPLPTEDWEPIVPPPVKPTGADMRHPTLGVPAAIYRYYSAERRFEGFQRRFNMIDKDGEAGKTFLPLRYGRLNGKEGWHASSTVS